VTEEKFNELLDAELENVWNELATKEFKEKLGKEICLKFKDAAKYIMQRGVSLGIKTMGQEMLEGLDNFELPGTRPQP